MAVAKDQIRQIITENNITSVADVYALLKDSFKDILQELLEAEMDHQHGLCRCGLLAAHRVHPVRHPGALPHVRRGHHQFPHRLCALRGP